MRYIILFQNSNISQFLLFLVMVFHCSQNWGFNFPIFACLTLLLSPGKVRHWNTWCIAQKMKFSITDFFSNLAKFCGFGQIRNGKLHFLCSDDIIPLPWKQSRFDLWTFCSLFRRDQGLIMPLWAVSGLWFLNYS